MVASARGRLKRPNHWLWVTRPTYYLDEYGNDRWDEKSLKDEADSDGWWSCHKDTLAGDLILLWRTSPKIDIGYLIQARSDAFSIADDDYAVEMGWDYGCEYAPVYKFANPVTKKDLDRDPYLIEWGAYRGRFQRRAFAIPPQYWEGLNKLLINKNSSYESVLANLGSSPVPGRVAFEKDIEDQLENNLSVLSAHGFNVSLFKDSKNGRSGRQYVCGETRGRIDLLCMDKSKKFFLVIELKLNRATDQTFAQIARYMGWVQKRLAKGRKVFGLVVSDGYDVNFEMASYTNDRIHHLNLEDVGIKK
ncbi:MAG: DUF91 domain-containing protein [Deltaproteobacteria bacterium]|nr:DUF91 domain-containing protein [Deltaproteobacteria bacterium]